MRAARDLFNKSPLGVSGRGSFEVVFLSGPEDCASLHAAKPVSAVPAVIAVKADRREMSISMS